MANISTSINLNVTSNNYSDVGGLAYFLAYISDYLPYVTLVSIGAVIGIIGNLIIMLTIIMNRELHSSTYMLMFNLSIADILISGFVDSKTIFSVFIGERYFINRPVLCSVIGFICFCACTESVFNLGFLAINRYINICHNRFYNKVFTTKLTLFYCVLTWLIGIFNNLPNLTGWSNFLYEKKSLSCVWNRQASLSYNWYLSSAYIIAPCLAIFLCYSRIFYFSHESKNRSNSSNTVNSLRLAKCLFVSFILYTICWLPYGLVLLIDFEDRFPRSVIMFSMTLGHLNSALNPVIYYYFNSAFRQGCMNLFNKIYCCIQLCRFRNNKVLSLGNPSN